MTTPFQGLRVVDLSDRASGAFAARLFGDFGADVVLVERAAGQGVRHEPPFLDDEPGPDRGAMHAYLNWNKRSIVVGPDPNLLASGFISRVDHPEAGPTWLAGRPWKFSAAPSSPLRASPCVGQHSREVFREELGIGDAEYESLVAAGVTGTLDDLVPPVDAAKTV